MVLPFWICAAVCLCGGVSTAQSAIPATEPPTTEPPTTTLRTASRIVYVDVVVRDGRGRIVHGLPASAFSVQENRQPQRVALFEEHTSADTAGRAEPSQRPKAGDALQQFAQAMRIEAPVSTMLALRAGEARANPDGTMTLPVSLDVHGVGFGLDEATHLRSAKLQLLTIAYPEAHSGHPVQSNHALDLRLEPEDYARVLQTGLPLDLSLVVPPGRYAVRVGFGSWDGAHRDAYLPGGAGRHGCGQSGRIYAVKWCSG